MSPLPVRLPVRLAAYTEIVIVIANLLILYSDLTMTLKYKMLLFGVWFFLYLIAYAVRNTS